MVQAREAEKVFFAGEERNPLRGIYSDFAIGQKVEVVRGFFYHMTSADCALRFMSNNQIIKVIQASELEKKYPSKFTSELLKEVPFFMIKFLPSFNGRNSIGNIRVVKMDDYLPTVSSAFPEGEEELGKDIDSYVGSMVGADSYLFPPLSRAASRIVKHTDHVIGDSVLNRRTASEAVQNLAMLFKDKTRPIYGLQRNLGAEKWQQMAHVIPQFVLSYKADLV